MKKIYKIDYLIHAMCENSVNIAQLFKDLAEYNCIDIVACQAQDDVQLRLTQRAESYEDAVNQGMTGLQRVYADKTIKYTS